MNEPARLPSEGRPTIELSRGVQYVVHETDAERAAEISGKFYPTNEGAAEDPAQPSLAEGEKADPLARICDLARRLGYNDAKTKMLIGQAGGNLAALERKPLNEMDEPPARTSSRKSNNGQGQQPEQESAPANQVASAVLPTSPFAKGAIPGEGRFLF